MKFVSTRTTLVVLAATFLSSGCSKPETASTGANQEAAPVSVTTVPVAVRTVRRTIPVVGTLSGYDDIVLAPKVEGRVLHVCVDVGDVVMPGTVLLELDPADYAKDVDRARRALDLELARIDLAQLLTKDEFKPENVPAVRRAIYSLESAQREFDRVKHTAGGISDREYHSAETDLQVARMTKSMAVVEATTALSSAWLKKDELTLAEIRLNDTKLRAPIPGGWEAWSAVVGPWGSPLRHVVAQRMLSEGEMVRSMPVTNAFRLVIDCALKLRASVPERYAPEIKIGQLVEVHVDAYPDLTFPGRVTRLNPTVDSTSRTFQAEVSVPNFCGKLKTGGFARASILARTESAVKSVPPQAVVSFAGVNKLFLVVDGKAVATPIEVGMREKDWVEIIGEIAPGAQVVLTGQSQLVDGSKVRIRRRDEG